jgi:hypothetical protein
MCPPVLGEEWQMGLKSGVKHSIPPPAGAEHEAALVAETPFDLPSLKVAELKCGFKHRSILCGFMCLRLWTRPDLMLSLICLSRFQSAPGEAHFKALQNTKRCVMCRRFATTIARAA